jgi:cephalosporin-C deacetylase-like acetyl esterase
MLRHALTPLLLLLLSPTLAHAAKPAAPSVATESERAVFAYDRSAPLGLETKPLSAQDGVEVYAMSFASPKGGRATGRLAVPQREGKKAGIVLMHGAPGNAEKLVPRALQLAKLGAVVVAVDAPFARRNAVPLSFTAMDRTDMVQLIVDLRRAVDLLLARPDVDPARIAYVGLSFGGATGGLFAGVDSRPAAYVLSVADGGAVSYFTTVDGLPEGPLEELPARERERWLQDMRTVQGIRWVGRARPGSILFLNGRQDVYVPPAKAEALHRAAGPSHTVRWYDAGHKLPEAAWQDIFHWLHERVGLDAGL